MTNCCAPVAATPSLDSVPGARSDEADEADDGPCGPVHARGRGGLGAAPVTARGGGSTWSPADRSDGRPVRLEGLMGLRPGPAQA